MFNAKLTNYLYENPVVAVVIIDNLEDALPTADALLEGGIKVIELALRTEVALKAIKKINNNTPEMLVIAGTVITVQQVLALSDAGVKLAVSPGVNSDVLSAAVKHKLPFAPGIATPSDIETAISFDMQILKFFPAEPIGSVEYLKSIANPYAHLGLKFIPLGGLTFNNFEDYLKCENVLAIGGSWIAKRNLINSGDWKSITSAAKEAVEKAAQARPAKAHSSLVKGLI